MDHKLLPGGVVPEDAGGVGDVHCPDHGEREDDRLRQFNVTSGAQGGRHDAGVQHAGFVHALAERGSYHRGVIFVCVAYLLICMFAYFHNY